MSEREPIDWDELEAETQHELVSLADKLGEGGEQSGGRTASRREFLGAITAAGLGGSLLSEGADRAFEDFVNPASAGTQSVAQFGEAGEPFDFVAEDIYGPGGQGSGDAVNFEAVSADQAVPNSSTTINVPSDQPTLQAAVENALYRFPNADQEVEVHIESGYAIQTGATRSDPAGQISDESVSLWLNGVDASHIRITSADATVPVESGFDGSVIRQINSRGVTLDCLIDMANTGTGAVGYSAEINATGYVAGHNGAGVINAPNRGLYIRQSSLGYAAFGANFSGAGTRGADVNHGSNAYIRDGDFSGAGTHGIRVHGAFVDALEANASNATQNGIETVNFARVAAQLVDVSNVGGIGVRCNESFVQAADATATGAGDRGARIDGGRLIARGADFSGYSNNGVQAAGGYANVIDTTISGSNSSSSSDIKCLQGSIISAHFSDGGANITTNSVQSDGIVFE